MLHKYGLRKTNIQEYIITRNVVTKNKETVNIAINILMKKHTQTHTKELHE